MIILVQLRILIFLIYDFGLLIADFQSKN